MKKNPCYGCVAPKRHLGCHDKCPDRAEWLEEEHRRRDARRAAIDEEVAMTDYMELARRRMRI